ncbi:MAG: peptidoglycan-binding domain-containing protein [Scytonema sp. PMC 1069.18]|nr:peptidoglycan-binding domain-containing protein [Scytonema sp. PMC 1069.18]MEC4884143.1 peptidoglycan-binding domain-containing protein [Scytonema sp. PMC 1070.18]
MTTTSNVVNLPVLRAGTQGAAVLLLQQLLEAQSYRTYGLDGIFGSKTEQAVKNYQTNQGLVVDGIVGEKTWAKLGDRLVNP